MPLFAGAQILSLIFWELQVLLFILGPQCRMPFIERFTVMICTNMHQSSFLHIFGPQIVI